MVHKLCWCSHSLKEIIRKVLKRNTKQNNCLLIEGILIRINYIEREKKASIVLYISFFKEMFEISRYYASKDAKA